VKKRIAQKGLIGNEEPGPRENEDRGKPRPDKLSTFIHLLSKMTPLWHLVFLGSTFFGSTFFWAYFFWVYFFLGLLFFGFLFSSSHDRLAYYLQ
jgi:hypothetical protein